MARGVVAIRTAGARLLGAELLEQRLARLEGGMRQRILEEGLAAGAEVLRRSAAQRAADHAELARAIQSKITTTQAGRAVALVGVERAKSRRNFSLVTLGYWREFGTKAHVIVPGAFRRVKRDRHKGAGTEPKSTKRVLASATAVFGRRVQHPGTRARPFLGAALAEDGARATHVMGQTIWERLRSQVGVA